MYFKLLPRVMEDRDTHLLKAPIPILVTEGMDIVVMAVYENAEARITFTLAPMETEDRESQLENA
jgi:uncharacterized protein (DUF302 family)